MATTVNVVVPSVSTVAFIGCVAMTGAGPPSEPPPPQAATMTDRAANAAAFLHFTETMGSSL
ncbi:hypothetical protein CDL60_19275 [Roseateles noduli]|nr:hypothetical protein CDL60_19275 [Roseateles noduli]